MLPYKKSANITNVVFDKEVFYSKTVKHFEDIKEVHPIPTDSIIYKTVTGIGATYGEIYSDRDSIIVLPHISIIKNKNEDHQKVEDYRTFAVHGDVTSDMIHQYINNKKSGPLKFLTTPKGLDKIMGVLDKFQVAYKEFVFLLIDECHKIIKDADYRNDLPTLMDHFFTFTNKAMVSATPIPPSDPRFIDHNFKNIKVSPEDKPKQSIEIIQAGSLVNGMQNYLADNPWDNYFIFFNSVEGIMSLKEQLQINDDYTIFCSAESKMKLSLNNEMNSQSDLGEFKKYNFFTSSFFNGLDIKLPYNPNVIVLTDCGYGRHTMLDPYTDVLQIVGRFRKRGNDLSYNKLTHINNVEHFTNPVSEEDALKRIKLSEHCHTSIDTLKYSSKDETFYPFFDQALSAVKPFANMLKSDGSLCYFLRDNYMDDERVKHYYQNSTALRNAYYKTGRYDIDYKKEKYEKSEILKLQRQSLTYSKPMNELMVNTLLDLEDYSLLDVYHEQRNIVKQLSYVMFDAFERLGYYQIDTLNYSKRKIENELLKLDIEAGRNSFPVINLMYKTFQLNTKYQLKFIKKKLEEIYAEFEIPYNAKSTDVERYFFFKSKDSKDDLGKRVYIFTEYKFNAVAQQLHI